MSNEMHIIDQYFKRGMGTRGAKVVEGRSRSSKECVGEETAVLQKEKCTPPPGSFWEAKENVLGMPHMTASQSFSFPICEMGVMTLKLRSLQK